MRIESWSLRLRVFLFFAALGFGSAAAVGAAGWLAVSRIGAEAIEPIVLGCGGAAFAILLLNGYVWQLFDEHIARPIQLLSGEMKARAHTRASGTVETAQARYLGSLGEAASGMAEALARARGDTESVVSRALGDVLSEKSRLEAVLRDLNECVVICNQENEILLYNAEAQRLLGLGTEIGLGRSLFGLISEQPVRHALERLTNRYRSGRYKAHRDHLSVAMVAATRRGGRTLEGRLSLILDAEETAVEGYVATLRDATTLIRDHAARDHLLKEMLDGLRRPSANLSAAVEILSGTPDLEEADRARFTGVATEEAETLARRIDDLAAAYAELRVSGWSMADVSTRALADCVADRLAETQAPALEHEGETVWLHCDSLSVVELVAMLVRETGRATGVRTISLEGRPEGGHVFLDLVWEGAPLTEATTEGWLARPLIESLAGLTGQDVLRHHRAEIWSDRAGEGRARLRLPLPAAVEDHASAPATRLAARPEFYDFALMRRTVAEETGARPLRSLDFCVFDTETTGLFPSAGDEIVQIAAVRVVNGRVLKGEAFDRLVDPGRRIPAASTRVHGITDEMVAGAGTAATVLPEFHAFAGGHVLVAHNAPFDMKFLQLKEGLIGMRFDMAVLDTVLLSAHLFGQGADHQLDALAERFGLAFEDGTRHTALADAVVTAEVLCRLIDALEASGVRTLADAMRVSEEAGAIRRRQAKY